MKPVYFVERGGYKRGINVTTLAGGTFPRRRLEANGPHLMTPRKTDEAEKTFRAFGRRDVMR